MVGTVPKIVIITGASGQGKTRLAQALVQLAKANGVSVNGILSPAVFTAGEKTAILVEDANSGEQRELAHVRQAGSEGDIQTGHWTFDPGSMAWGNRILAEAGECGLLVVDELGPLEFTQHKGWVEVMSQPSQGTTFKVFFPATTAPMRLPAPAPASTEMSYGHCETVFLVEDDPVLRELVREVLTHHKYRVVEAASGAEALQTWDLMKGQADLLLTDMVMPNGVSGWELANQLRKRRADLKVIFSSGYSEEVVGNDFDLERAWFLPKPYNPQQLAQMVRRCLDRSPTSIEPAVAASIGN